MNGWDQNPDAAHLTPLERKLAAIYLKVRPDDVKGPITGTLVGEAPGPHSSPKLPLFPYPKNSAGGRIHAISAMPVGTYLGRLARVNLLTHAEIWDKRDAVVRAAELSRLFPDGHRVVLLGQRVAEAFGFQDFWERREYQGVTAVSIPHPSGKNLIYNSPHARVAARACVQWAADYMTEALVR